MILRKQPTPSQLQQVFTQLSPQQHPIARSPMQPGVFATQLADVAAYSQHNYGNIPNESLQPPPAYIPSPPAYVPPQFPNLLPRRQPQMQVIQQEHESIEHSDLMSIKKSIANPSIFQSNLPALSDIARSVLSNGMSQPSNMVHDEVISQSVIPGSAIRSAQGSRLPPGSGIAGTPSLVYYFPETSAIHTSGDRINAVPSMIHASNIATSGQDSATVSSIVSGPFSENIVSKMRGPQSMTPEPRGMPLPAMEVNPPQPKPPIMMPPKPPLPPTLHELQSKPTSQATIATQKSSSSQATTHSANITGLRHPTATNPRPAQQSKAEPSQPQIQVLVPKPPDTVPSQPQCSLFSCCMQGQGTRSRATSW